LYDRFVTHRTDANSLPPDDFADIIRQNVMTVAPKGMLQVHLGGGRSATEANELAMNSALTWFSKEHKKEKESLSVLGFSNAHHGTSTPTLSASSLASNPNNLPTFGWPTADFP
jgi:acetylornithine/succinyldiaminopimelate/putrescine aminotransferase